MTPTPSANKLLLAYLRGEMKLIQVCSDLNITSWEAQKLLKVMFDNNMFEAMENNFLYDKRMAEVTKQRNERFTQEEIASDEKWTSK